jgi:N6-L-threonylcarbamoyladenine synthase
MILSIDTSCDETAAAVVLGRRVFSNVIYSQVLLHQKWGGVVPSIAKRAHEERIDFVINATIKKILSQKNLFTSKLASPPQSAGSVAIRSSSQSEGSLHRSLAQTATRFINFFDYIDAIAVTVGPGLAPALEVGIKKAKELAEKFNKKIISVNHLEGHIYSPFVQNSKGNPKIDFHFPYLVLTVSGGHTSLVIFEDHLKYKVIGETIDDAAGEALDKAAKLLGLGYPGGPVIERLAKEVDNRDFYHFPRPMVSSDNLNFSFSGLKTSFYYFLKKMNEKEKIKKIRELSSSFQQAVFETLIIKTEKAIKKTGIKNLALVGGVSANFYLRKLFRNLAKKYNGQVLFPSFKYLCGDNASMIGVAASFKAQKNLFVSDIKNLDRMPRMSL